VLFADRWVDRQKDTGELSRNFRCEKTNNNGTSSSQSSNRYKKAAAILWMVLPTVTNYCTNSTKTYKLSVLAHFVISSVIFQSVNLSELIYRKKHTHRVNCLYNKSPNLPTNMRPAF
jgi:hypothetical protein